MKLKKNDICYKCKFLIIYLLLTLNYPSHPLSVVFACGLYSSEELRGEGRRVNMSGGLQKAWIWETPKTYHSSSSPCCLLQLKDLQGPPLQAFLPISHPFLFMQKLQQVSGNQNADGMLSLFQFKAARQTLPGTENW